MRRVEPGVVAVGAIALAFVVHAWLFRFTMDDSYISLQYARSLMEGHGLVFNPGERVEGYSNFSWTMLLALLLAADLPALAFARWIGVACGAATVVVTARFARALTGTWGAAAVGSAALVASCSALALWSTSGLETAAFVLLVTLALERGLAPEVSPRGRKLAPVLFALASLTRPDGPLLFGLWLVASAPPRVGTRSGRRDLALDAGIFAALLAPFLAFKLAYYGDVLPNTYYAKAGVSTIYLERGVEYALGFLRAYGAWGIAPVLALLALRRGASRPVVASLLFLFAGYAAYLVAIGGDVLLAMRFWLPVVPVGAVLVALGARELRRAALPVVLGLAVLGLARNWDPLQEDRRTAQRFVERMGAIGAFWKERLAPGETIACTAIGAVRWYSERPVLDMLGLTDREIAREPQILAGLEDSWLEKKYNAPSVLRRRPAVILFNTGARPSAKSEKALFLYDDFHRAYYAYQFRTDPALRGNETVYRLRPDAPAPAPDAPHDDPAFVEEFARGVFLQTPGRRDLPAAAEHFARSDALGPPSFTEGAAWRASVLDVLGDERAPALLESAVERDSLALRAVRHLGHHRLAAGRRDEAEALFRLHVRRNPDSPSGWEGLARVARDRGQYREAAELAAESISRWNTNASSLVLFGNACLLVGDPDAAEGAFRRALAVRPGLAEAEHGLETVRRARQLQ